MSDNYELSRRKALLGLGTIGVAGAAAGMGTSALFSDEESFTNNSITAGTTNLTATLGFVDVQQAEGASGPVASAEDLEISLDEGDNPATADGDPRVGVTVGDMKPGDCIILRTTARVEDNPMYVAVDAKNVSEDGGETTEPEPTPDEGELGDALDITFGYDSDRTSLHDNSLEGSITPDPNGELSGSEFLNNLGMGYLYRGRNGASGNPPGGHGDGDALPTRIGTNGNADREAVTHFIEICLPVDVGNEVQGDKVSFDLVWSAEQVRNNADPANSTQVDGNVN